MSDTEFGGFTVMTAPDGQQTGVVTVCEPPHYCQATWDIPPHPPSTVAVDVIPGRQQAQLVRTHRGLTPVLLNDHESHWTDRLDRLTRYVDNRRSSSGRSEV
jgi:hypothetical protein